MLNRLISFSLAQRGFILLLAALLIFFAYRKLHDLPIDVLPDLTKPTITILTESKGLAPEEVESRVTIPIEGSLLGVAGVDRIRTISDVGLSLTMVEFKWGTHLKDVRPLVSQRLADLDLPSGIRSYMAPEASLMGNIMMVGVMDPTGKRSPADVREIADWVVAREFRTLSGIAEVTNMGGGVKEIQVQPDPEKMLGFHVSYDELRTAISQCVRNTTGGYISGDNVEMMIRNLGMTEDLDEIGKTIIRYENGRPLCIKDVAHLKWSTQPMRGDSGAQGHPATVISITKAPGFDTLALTKKLEEKMIQLKSALPQGLELITLYRQADYIHVAIDNLKEALLHGGIMVCLVLFLFLLNFRITLITLTAIPLSLGIAILVFDWFSLGINSMTLGGFAVAIGMVVDDAIVDVENVFRRLRENAALENPRPRLQVIAQASGEVRSSILYATLIIVLVFVPLLSLSGVEGRLFAPIAIATIVSMLASFLVSLTLIPVLSSYFLNPKPHQSHRDHIFLRFFKLIFERLFLRPCLSQPFLIITLALALVLFGAVIYPQMGKNFLPPFREPTTVVAMALSPGTSLEKSREVAHTTMKLIMEVPEVKTVSFRAGRAENGDHVVPVSTVEFDIEFHEKMNREREAVLNDIKAKTSSLPGTFSVVSTPLADRIGHMLAGVAGKVVVKVYGNDLEELKKIGHEIAEVAHGIKGLEQTKAEQQSAVPQLRIEANRERLLAYGMTTGSLNNTLASLLGGEELTEVTRGERSYPVVLRLPDEWRTDFHKLGGLLLDTASQAKVPLRNLADLRQATGPNNIKRENSQRLFIVSANPTSERLVELVDELKKQVSEKISLPPGYRIAYEGEYVAQKDASERILATSLVVLVIIIFLLYTYFKNWNLVIQVLLDVPIALTGGILLTAYHLNNISIATLVGFIAVAGISVRNSIMLISHYLHLMKHEGEQFSKKMIIRGTLERLAPVLMTAFAAGIALLPLCMDLGFLPLVEPGNPQLAPGKEILNPVAVVIVGGLLSSTFFGLLVTPAVFWMFGNSSVKRRSY